MVAHVLPCLEHSVGTAFSEQGRTCFCSCQGLRSFPSSEVLCWALTVTVVLQVHRQMAICFLPALVSPAVVWRQQGFSVSQRGLFMGMRVSEEHCNNTIAEKQSTIFRTSLCTLGDTTSSGGTLADQGREWIVMMETQASSKWWRRVKNLPSFRLWNYTGKHIYIFHPDLSRALKHHKFRKVKKIPYLRAHGLSAWTCRACWAFQQGWLSAMNVEGHQVNSLETSRPISVIKNRVFRASHITALLGTDDVQTV